MNVKEAFIKNTAQAYSGERGCVCGCLGNYYLADTPKGAANIKRITNKIFSLINEQASSIKAQEKIDVDLWEHGVSVTDNRPKNGRTFILYLEDK